MTKDIVRQKYEITYFSLSCYDMSRSITILSSAWNGCGVQGSSRFTAANTWVAPNFRAASSVALQTFFFTDFCLSKSVKYTHWNIDWWYDLRYYLGHWTPWKKIRPGSCLEPWKSECQTAKIMYQIAHLIFDCCFKLRFIQSGFLPSFFYRRYDVSVNTSTWLISLHFLKSIWV